MDTAGRTSLDDVRTQSRTVMLHRADPVKVCCQRVGGSQRHTLRQGGRLDIQQVGGRTRRQQRSGNPIMGRMETDHRCRAAPEEWPGVSFEIAAGEDRHRGNEHEHRVEQPACRGCQAYLPQGNVLAPDHLRLDVENGEIRQHGEQPRPTAPRRRTNHGSEVSLISAENCPMIQEPGAPPPTGTGSRTGKEWAMAVTSSSMKSARSPSASPGRSRGLATLMNSRAGDPATASAVHIEPHGHDGPLGAAPAKPANRPTMNWRAATALASRLYARLPNPLLNTGHADEDADRHVPERTAGRGLDGSSPSARQQRFHEEDADISAARRN